MSVELPDRHDLLFGRQEDLRGLGERAREAGVTFVTGRPKMGKTWLLQEVGRRLAYEERQLSADRARFLVGYHECLGEEDQVLRAVSDLYARWLEQADHAQQAKRLLARGGGRDLVPGVGRAVAELFDKADPVKLGGFSLGGLVKGAMEKLAGADTELKSGGTKVARLNYELARDLVALLAGLAGQRVVVILDGWDKSGSIDHERTLLEAVLAHLGDWDHCHFFVGVRHPAVAESPDDTPALVAARQVEASSARAALVELQSLAGGATDAAEAARLVRHLRELLPRASELTDERLLAIVDGYPGTLNRWRDLAARLRTSARIEQDLVRTAADAQAYRYPEFARHLPKLEGDPRTLALRLALVLRLDQQLWDALEPVLNDGLAPKTWKELVRGRVLEPGSPFPSYGHDTRHQAARGWFLQQDNLQIDVLDESERLILALAGRIDRIRSGVRPYAIAITSVQATSPRVLAQTGIAPICAAVASVLGEVVDSSVFLGACRQPRCAGAAPLLATALVNAMIDAQAAKDRGRRDALLDELRLLQQAQAASGPVREQLALALVNTFVYAKEEHDLARRDRLLDELRGLPVAGPDGSAVRGLLAEAIFGAVIDARAEGDAGRRDALLDELRRRQAAQPDEAAVRQHFAHALFSATVYAKEEQDLAGRGRLLEELDRLSAAHPADGGVRGHLATAIFNAIVDAKEEKDLAGRDARLEQLRQLHRANPDQASVREQLADALGNVGLDAREEGDLARRDRLLDELRQFHLAHPADGPVRDNLARALYNTVNAAKEEADLARRDALLDELRRLRDAAPDDDQVRAHLAKAVFNTSVDAGDEGDPARCAALLEELRQLHRGHPADAPVREVLAKGLVNAVDDAREKGDAARHAAMLAELRQLRLAYPGDNAIRDLLEQLLAEEAGQA